MDKKKENQFKIAELFMAQASRDRRFYGTIKRGWDADGTPVVCGRIEVKNGFILAQDGCQDGLGIRLDELVKMVLDLGLHSEPGATQIISGTTCFLN
ncbi:MAG: hypothetical protein DRJ13_16625 [Bacteroidetes bacterium]|nr:MAG: hypothetical protein DRJ13_16625 [Bacteroidota bacterium]